MIIFSRQVGDGSRSSWLKLLRTLDELGYQQRCRVANTDERSVADASFSEAVEVACSDSEAGALLELAAQQPSVRPLQDFRLDGDRIGLSAQGRSAALIALAALATEPGRAATESCLILEAALQADSNNDYVELTDHGKYALLLAQDALKGSRAAAHAAVATVRRAIEESRQEK